MMNDDARGGLVPLDELDGFEVAEGYTDIRGFEAYLEDGRKVGEVDELLVDPAARRVAAITIDVDHDLRDAGRAEGLSRVPIEAVEIDTPARRVLVRAAGVGSLGLAGTAGAAGAGLGSAAGELDANGERRITLAEEELELHKRQTQAGQVDIHKTVETQHVSESVPVTHEEVTVERRPVTDLHASTEPTFEGDTIRVPVVEEKLVVEKRPVVTEELVVHRSQVQGEQVVEADLRRERAEVNDTSRDLRYAADEAAGRDALDADTRGTRDGLDVDNPLRGGRDLDGDGVR